MVKWVQILDTIAQSFPHLLIFLISTLINLSISLNLHSLFPFPHSLPLTLAELGLTDLSVWLLDDALCWAAGFWPICLALLTLRQRWTPDATVLTAQPSKVAAQTKALTLMLFLMLLFSLCTVWECSSIKSHSESHTTAAAVVGGIYYRHTFNMRHSLRCRKH